MSFGRPLLRTSYSEDTAIFPTWFQKGAIGLFILVLFLMPFDLPIISQIPFIRFLGDKIWLGPVTNAMIFGIAALGLNILTGVTGQVSLGHAFFMGVGAYAAVALGGEGDGAAACIPFADGRCGMGLPIWIWLPMSAVVAALVGILVSPAAVKVRGLYLAIVTVGLVFIGQHLGRMFPQYAGDPESGRNWPSLDIRLWKEENPLISMTTDGKWFGVEVSEEAKQFWFVLILLILSALLAKNLVRSRTGRALQAIRDRDVAAEVMGVPERKYKRIGFALSSAYAGLAGALFASYNGRLGPPTWSLILSVEFIAILLIGGVGTIAGTLMGTVFVELIPDLVEEFTDWLAGKTDATGPVGWIANFLLTDGSAGDFGPISTATQAPGWPMSVYQWNLVIYGLLIVIFLIYEPLGLYGIWLRIRNYWKGWPFSY